MAGADLDHEEDVDAAQGDRAVDMEEVARQHGRGLGVQELPPCGAVALRRGRYPQAFSTRRTVEGPDADAQAEQFALDPLVAQPGFSRATCSISSASLASTGGRPPLRG